MTRQENLRSEVIKDFDTYIVQEDGTVRNKYDRIIKPDRNGCVSVREQKRRKTLSITRLMAISFLGMPDDKQHRAYKKDPNGGFGIDNIAWDSLTMKDLTKLVRTKDKS